MTKVEKQQYQRVSHKCRWCFWLSLILVLGLSLVKIVASNRAATWGKSVDGLKREAQKIRQENEVLKSQLAQKNGGLIQLREDALRQGFVDKPQVVYFGHEPRLAFTAH